MTKGIRKRGASYIWDVTINGKRITGTCSSVADAVSARTNAQKQLVTESTAVPVWTLATAYERAMDEWVRQGTRSLDTCRINSRKALSYFGENTPVNIIGRSELIAYATHLTKEGSSGATVNRALSALSRMLSGAYAEGIISTLPKLPRHKESAGRIRFLTIAEEKDLLHLLRSWGKDDHADAVEVLLATGMRTGEMFKLLRRDVTVKAGKATRVTLWYTKNGGNRTTPLTQRASEIITARMKGLKAEDKIFPYDRWWLRPTWDRARDLLGYAEDTQYIPHMLRHTTASRLAQRGIPLPIIKEFLGHKSIQTTMRYAHLTVDSLRSAVDALELDGAE